MPNFVKNKGILLNVLDRFDYRNQISVQRRTGTGQDQDFLLTHVLLDVCCSFIVPDDQEKRKKLYNALNERLYKDKMLPSMLNHEHLESMQCQAKDWFMNYLQTICVGLGNPESLVPPAHTSDFFSTKIYPNTYEQNFEEVDVIASGGFGTVCKAVHKIDGVAYAVKKIYYSVDQKKEAAKVLSEVRSISTLSHANIVSYKNCWVQLVQDRDDDQSSSITSSLNDSRQTDFDCSLPSSASSVSRKQKRNKKMSLLKQAVSNASSSDTKDLSYSSLLMPHYITGSTKKGFFTSPISEESSSDSMEDADACLDQLSELSSLSFPHSSQDSSICFDHGDQTIESSSAVAFVREEGVELVTHSSTSSSKGRRRSPNTMRVRAMLCIQMEFCDFDLNRWLEDRAAGKDLPFNKDVKDIFRDIVKGVVHIHSKSFIHRDLKPSNIFYSKRDGSMKIGDFGLATLSHTITNQPRAVHFQSHTSNLGTYPYMAPEQKDRRDYNEKVDIYSLGVILVELLIPFKTRTEFNQVLTTSIHRGVLPSQLTDQFPQYVNLVENLLNVNPKLRMSAKEILDQPLMQDNWQVEKRRLLLENKSLKLSLKLKEKELEAARKEIALLKAENERLKQSHPKPLF